MSNIDLIRYVDSQLLILSSTSASDADRSDALSRLDDPFEPIKWEITRKKLKNKRRGKQYVAVIEHIERLHSLMASLPSHLSESDLRVWQARTSDLRDLLSDAGEG